jgi:lambda family phage portal protein
MRAKIKSKSNEPNLFTAVNSVQEMIQNSPYTGASNKKSMRNWQPTSATADEALLPSLDMLRARSRDAFRNQPAARGALKTIRTGVVGAGLQIQPSIDYEFLKITRKQAEAWEAKTKQEFRLWSESRNCDFSRQQTFFGLQKLAFASQRIAGDCFVLLPWKPYPGMPYDLRVQLIEADRVCNPNDLNDKSEIAGGIERNEDGVPIAIHIRTPHPHATLIGVNNLQATWQRIPFYGRKTGTRNVLHLINIDRIGQTRGEPILAPVIDTLKQISDYSAAELSAAVVNALLTVFIERPETDTTSNSNLDKDEKENPWDNPNNYTLGAGTWVDGAPGEKMNLINAARPSSQFDPFFLASMKQIGMALAIPYEVLIKHFSSSYSASRAAMLDFYKDCLAEREDFSEAFCQPIYEAFLEEAILKNRIIAPGYLNDPYVRLAYSGAYWHGPAQGQIDEVKEVNAAILRVKGGFSTKQDEARKLTGQDYKDIMKKQAEEKNLAEDLGLKYEADMPGMGISKNEPSGGNNEKGSE